MRVGLPLSAPFDMAIALAWLENSSTACAWLYVLQCLSGAFRSGSTRFVMSLDMKLIMSATRLTMR